MTDNETLQSLLDELGGLYFTKCADYKPSDEAVELCGFTAPTAVLTASYVPDSGTEGDADADHRHQKMWMETAITPGWTTTPPFT